MTQENETAPAHASVILNGVPTGVLSLKIGRTGEKAKYQGQVVEIDLAKLPAESIAFALVYGFKQYIADGTAGSEDQAGYDLGIRLRLQKLAEGDFTRAAGERGPKVETAEGLARKNAAAAIRAHLTAKGVKAEAKVINEAAAKQVESNPKWLKEAQASIEASRKLAETLDLGDLFADLTGAGGEAETEGNDEG